MVKLLYTLFILLFVDIAFAGPIFKEELQDGRVVFTDKPKDPKQALKVELPAIARYTFSPEQDSLKKITASTLTCSAHGGTDCQAGPDDDGSVICADGFRGVKARFGTSCKQAKLVISDFNYDDSKNTLLVLVRNPTDIKATNIAVKIQQNGEKLATATGVQDINPYEAGEYLFNSIKLLGKVRQSPVDNIVISCENCG